MSLGWDFGVTCCLEALPAGVEGESEAANEEAEALVSSASERDADWSFEPLASRAAEFALCCLFVIEKLSLVVNSGTNV